VYLIVGTGVVYIYSTNSNGKRSSIAAHIQSFRLSVSVCALCSHPLLLPLAVVVCEGVGELAAHLCREIEGQHLRPTSQVFHDFRRFPTNNRSTRCLTSGPCQDLKFYYSLYVGKLNHKLNRQAKSQAESLLLSSSSILSAIN
jgi:hypothetical protein